MARRKGSESQEGRRWIERGKNVLIAALTCSALLLVWQTPIASQFQDWMREPPQTAAVEEHSRLEALTPYLATVRNRLGLYGVSYDGDLVGRTFDQFSPLLGEGLATASAAELISGRQWRTMLELPGFFCTFQGAVPLSVLSAWLGQERGPAGDAQALLLCWDGRQAWLCWREGETYFRAAAQVAYEGHLEDLLEDFTPNGAAFAYTLAQEDKLYERLDPYVLVSMTAPQPPVYTLLAPDFVADKAAREQLLGLLGFQLGEGSAYESAGELAISENGDRVRLGAGGAVTFHAGTETRYRVTSEKDRPTAQEAALAAWDLLNQVAGAWKGEGNFLLSRAEATAEGWTVTFHSSLNGIPVLTGSEGWCARFTIKGHKVSDFTVWVRSYTKTEETSLVPGERLAAAALESLPDAGGRLLLCYSDDGSTALQAGWVAEEEDS